MARVWLVCTILVIVAISGGCDSRDDAQKRLEAYEAERKIVDDLNQHMSKSMDRPTLKDLGKAMEKDKQYRETIRQGQQAQALQTPTAAQLPSGWHDNLRRQIQADKGCKAERIWNVWRRRPGQDAVLQAVGVQCVDGRRFMAYRPVQSERFVFERCGSSRTRACLQ